MICNLGVVGSNPTRGSKKSKDWPGEYQSGQMGQTVNLLAYAFGGSNPSSPTFFYAEVAQLIEHQPSKLRVASLSLVFRSTESSPKNGGLFLCIITNYLYLCEI